MELADFDFHLPDELIAQYPARQRDLSRLLVLDRKEGSIQHRRFCDLVDFLCPQDAVVINQTRVFPARLRGCKTGTGGQVELLLVRPQEDGAWLAIGRPGRRLGIGARLELGGGKLRAEVVGRTAEGRVQVRFAEGAGMELIEEVGEMPLPPYIRRPAEEVDRQRYQTVFACQAGAVAAPTAGLHFTAELLERLAAQGTGVVPVLLHVGPGTFEPVRQADFRRHRIEPEYCQVCPESAAELNRRRQGGGRILAVGTTVVRTLETAAVNGQVQAMGGWTDRYIYPPYQFKAVDALVTNFHLPRSSLLLLVAAFAGRELVLEAYVQAVRQGYRFYSYGDAMLIL